MIFFSYPAKADLANYDLIRPNENDYVDHKLLNDRYGTITELQHDCSDKDNKNPPPYHQVTILGRVGAESSLDAGQRTKDNNNEIDLTLPNSVVVIDNSMPTVIGLNIGVVEEVYPLGDFLKAKLHLSPLSLDRAKSQFHTAEEVVPEDGHGDPWLVEDATTGNFIPHFPGKTTLYYSAQVQGCAVMTLLSSKKYEVEVPIQVYKVD